MRRSAGKGLAGFLALLPALFIAGAVGGLFFLNAKGSPPSGGAGTAAPTTIHARGKPSPIDNSRIPARADETGATPRPKKAVAGLSLRILSWNLRDCAAMDGKTGERLAFHTPIAEVLAKLRPDIAAFQEIQQDDEKGGDIALLQVALAKSGWAMPYQTSIETGGPDDIALFSRYPILESGPVLEPSPSDPWPRPGLHAVVAAGGTVGETGGNDRREKLEIFVFHLKAMADKDSESARKAQSKALADLLRKDMAQGTLSNLTVVAGDLNTTNPGDRGSPASTLGFLELKDDADPSNDFMDAIESLNPPVPTFVDRNYSSVLDHLILSPGAAAALSPGSALVFKDLPISGKIPVSDHRPVLVELELAAEK